MLKKNFFELDKVSLEKEYVEEIHRNDSFKVERIISNGHSSGKDFWYDQETNEFVLLLSGEAKIQFEDETIELSPGDYITIPAHKRHRVEYTSSIDKTFWMTIHYM